MWRNIKKSFPKFLAATGVLFLSAGAAVTPARAQPGPVTSAHTEVELIAKKLSVFPGDSILIGLRMKMEPDWHVYWRNSGDSGLTTKIDWELPPNIELTPLMWPYPRVIDTAGIIIYGYDDEVLLMTELQTPMNLSDGDHMMVRAEVNWLACRVECVPGHAELELTIPVYKQFAQDHQTWKPLFERTEDMIPVKRHHWQITALDRGELFEIIMRPEFVYNFEKEGLYFFPYRNDVIEHTQDQGFTVENDEYNAKLPKSDLLGEEKLERLEGIIYFPNGWNGPGTPKAIEISEPVIKAAALPAQTPDTGSDASPPLLLVILFAFAGGLILNLMPCVLPVLSIKVLHLVEQAHEHQQKVWQHGISYTFGVLVSFWALAGFLIGLKFAGQQVGWGFQFQSPEFLIILTLIFFAFALNLFGFFQVGSSFAAIGSRTPVKKGLGGSFFSGILATIVATPCTAPFMGTAIGVAMVQPVSIAFAIFTFLGLGMAFPFLLLSAFPWLLKVLPKPGAWMVGFKKFLGLLLIITCAWLVWLLYLQAGRMSAVLIAGALLVMMIGFKLIGMSQQPAAKITLKVITFLLGLIIIGTGGWISYYALQQARDMRDAPPVFSRSNGAVAWQNYTPELMEALLQQEKPVFIDFTAAWCLSCQVNKQVALQSREVIEKFKELDVILVRADWTHRDDAITEALAKFGKNSIPVYVLYRRDKSMPPHMLPELLTPGIVLDALQRFAR